jgi:hypothetical protein
MVSTGPHRVSRTYATEGSHNPSSRVVVHRFFLGDVTISEDRGGYKNGEKGGVPTLHSVAAKDSEAAVLYSMSNKESALL